jgi:hypothetical protein
MALKPGSRLLCSVRVNPLLELLPHSILWRFDGLCHSHRVAAWDPPPVQSPDLPLEILIV